MKRIKSLIRRIICSKKLNKVHSISLRKTTPISHVFGFDRGLPIDRYYIEKFLKENASYVHGNILEIADSNYSRKFSHSKDDVFHVLTFDNPPSGEKIIKGDLTKLETLPENLIDCFICTQTLNFIYDVRTAIKGLYKILNKGGVVLATVGGISQISRYDMDRWGDYWRFTDLSIKKLMEEVFGPEHVQVVTYGNALTATAFIQGLSQEDIKNKRLFDVHDEDYQVTIGVVARKRC